MCDWTPEADMPEPYCDPPDEPRDDAPDCDDFDIDDAEDERDRWRRGEPNRFDPMMDATLAARERGRDGR